MRTPTRWPRRRLPPTAACASTRSASAARRGRPCTSTVSPFTRSSTRPCCKQISQLTGGTYYNAESEQDLLKIYDNLDPQLVIKPEKMEVTSIFAGASILVLLIGGVFSLLWFSRLP